MSPEDPRHGTTRGFHAGCRDRCCRRAIARYEKATKYRKQAGIVWAIPAAGTQRRIQALMALGWTSTDIAQVCGYRHRNSVLRVLNGQGGRPCRWVERQTFRNIAAAYERLSMTLPEQTGYRKRARTIAQSKGYAPPLAWDDDSIDDPAAKPSGSWRPVAARPAAELLAEWAHLRGLGVSAHHAARQLGVTVEAVEKAIERTKESAA